MDKHAMRGPMALSIALILVTAVTLTFGCAPAAAPSPAPAAQPAAASTAGAPAAQPAAAPTSGPAAKASNLKMAMVLPGPISDADFNSLGYKALKDLEKQFGIATAYSESVAVADAERVSREYISSGYNVISYFGAQFNAIATKLAEQFPNVNFLILSSGEIQGLPPNVWNIARKQYQPFYAVGTLAALSTKANKIGLVAGVRIPDFVAVVNTVKQAVSENNPKAELAYVFVGDQNDPVKARSAAVSQISSGVDFIISIVNLGMTGVVEAAKAATPKKILLSTHTTEKKELAPDLLTVSALHDYAAPYAQVLTNIQAGKRGGYTEMRAGNGLALSQIANVPDDVAKKTKDAFDAVVKGTKQVPEVTDKIIGE